MYLKMINDFSLWPRRLVVQLQPQSRIIWETFETGARGPTPGASSEAAEVGAWVLVFFRVPR